MNKMKEYMFEWVGNNVGKGEKAANQHYSLFLKCFQNPFSLELFKLWIVCLTAYNVGNVSVMGKPW